MTTDRKRRDFYEERYAVPPGAMRDYRLYLDILPCPKGSRVLDVGCGEGHILQLAQERGLRAAGIDFSYGALRAARRRAAEAWLISGSGEALPFADGVFDRLMCLGTLEHFTSPESGARELRRVLAPNGRAMIVVPNRRFPVWLVRKKGTEQRDIGERMLTRREWTTMLRQNGLRVLQCTRDPWHTNPLRPRRDALLVHLLYRIVPLEFTYQFAFVCEPVKEYE